MKKKGVCDNRVTSAKRLHGTVVGNEEEGKGLPEVKQALWWATTALYKSRGRRGAPPTLVHGKEEGDELEANIKDMIFKVEAHQNEQELAVTARKGIGSMTRSSRNFGRLSGGEGRDPKGK